jgi:5-oxopent-3-ene-1,2,5-tricarboxylate decarboxylase/2-hydroxyhepta-2,4-diene-1,7-dioate isomerase
MNVIGMANQGDRALPLLAFLKPAASVVADGEPIVVRGGRVEAEGELAYVVGRGYALANDVTCRESAGVAAKAGEGWTPLGPVVESVADVEITVSVNGVAHRPGRVSELARGLDEVLAYVGSFMTLRDGDVVLLGAPGETPAIKPGDVVTVSAPGLGSVTNEVIA